MITSEVEYREFEERFDIELEIAFGLVGLAVELAYNKGDNWFDRSMGFLDRAEGVAKKLDEDSDLGGCVNHRNLYDGIYGDIVKVREAIIAILSSQN